MSFSNPLIFEPCACINHSNILKYVFNKNLCSALARCIGFGKAEGKEIRPADEINCMKEERRFEASKQINHLSSLRRTLVRHSWDDPTSGKTDRDQAMQG